MKLTDAQNRAIQSLKKGDIKGNIYDDMPVRQLGYLYASKRTMKTLMDKGLVACKNAVYSLTELGRTIST